VKYCAEVLENLKTLIERHSEEFHLSTKCTKNVSRRWWKQLGFALKKKEFENHVAGIERAKSLLLAVQSQMMM